MSAHFITLTYDTQYVPISKNGLLTLDKVDLQKYLKRLRWLERGSPYSIKYYAVGEYGKKRKRPHYHLILFNVLDEENIKAAWSLDDQAIGDVHYGSVTAASVGYTLKYINKPGKAGISPGDDRQREFSIMSKKLGDNYLSQIGNVSWHKADLVNRMYLTVEGGKKISMPRYYKDKIYDEDERNAISANYAKETHKDLGIDVYDLMAYQKKSKDWRAAVYAAAIAQFQDASGLSDKF